MIVEDGSASVKGILLAPIIQITTLLFANLVHYGLFKKFSNTVVVNKMVNARKARKGAKAHEFFAGIAPLRELIDATILLISTEILKYKAKEGFS